ncbi:MAG: hypothetical protein ACQESG_06330 [Nanobdellota archaeon]
MRRILHLAIGILVLIGTISLSSFEYHGLEWELFTTPAGFIYAATTQGTQLNQWWAYIFNHPGYGYEPKTHETIIASCIAALGLGHLIYQRKECYSS